MKKNSAFKLRSGNKPSVAKLSGVMKQSPAKKAMNTNMGDTIKSVLEPGFVKLNRAIKKKKQEFIHSTNVPKGTKTRADGKLVNKTNPVKTDPSGRYMTPNTNFRTKPVEPKTTKPNPDGSKTTKPKTKDSLKKTTKKKVTFAEAYKKRDMKTYGNLNLKEYTAEAKRQIKNKKATSKTRPKTHKELQSEMPGGKNFKKSEPRGSGERMTTPKGSWDAPKSQMKGSLKPADKTAKTKTTKKADLIVTKDAKKTQSVKDARAKRKEAKKAVRTARKTSGRGSAEVKAAKEARRTARKNVRIAKKNRRATRKQTKSFLKN